VTGATATLDDATPRAVPQHGAGRCAAIAAGVWLALVGAYVGSAWLLGGPGAVLDPATDAGVEPLVRFNAVYAAIIAFTVGVMLLEREATPRDLAALRAAVDLSDPEWARLGQSLGLPRSRGLARAVVAGVLLGACINGLGALVGGMRAAWAGHFVWMGILAMALFGLLVPMAARSVRRARTFSRLGARLRVDLLDADRLAPFGRVALRGAAYWLVGSAIAMLLIVDADAWGIVVGVNVVTVALGAAAFLLPVRGVRRRLRDAKRAELAWTHEAIRHARAALASGRPGAPGAVELPALLAWEARVREVREWPFDTSTLLRLALLALVPLGSWLGGALVERLVDTFLG
jgi:hypothetical protein